MCETLIVGGVCWLVVLGLVAIPVGIACLAEAMDALARWRTALLEGVPFARIHEGAVRLEGILRADAGTCYLEEPSTGRRARIEAGLSRLPPPGTLVTFQGEALGRAPDPRAQGYREMQELWRLRPDEICLRDDTPVLRPAAWTTPPRRLRALGAIGAALIALGVIFGVGWPSLFNWCRCVWP